MVAHDNGRGQMLGFGQKRRQRRGKRLGPAAQGERAFGHAAASTFVT
jgi:hypothetical protein